MKSVIVLSLLLTGVMGFSANVTSQINGTVTYLPTEGAIIKKGEPLVKFDSEGIDYKIAKAKLDIAYCKENLKDKKSDLTRAKGLNKTNAISHAKFEDVIVSYHKCLLEIGASELILKQLIWDKESYVINSPYDVKIIKYIVTPNSGVRLGDEIIVVEFLNRKRGLHNFPNKL